MNHIRPVAICVFLNNGKILVAEGYDEASKQNYYRPLGGGIEFGERSTETICRELLEEVNAEVDRESLKYLGAMENIFHYNGAVWHEIMLVYDGQLKQSALYEQAVITGREANGEPIRAVWKRLDEFGEGKSILYPTGPLAMLGDA